MKKYYIYCYNNKNKMVYKIEVEMREETLKKQINEGYIRFFDKKYGDTICYLNLYNKIIIKEYQ